MIATASINFVLYGMWYWWDTPRTWGPRFQLTTVAFLTIPLGVWLSDVNSLRNLRKLAAAILSIGFFTQLAATLIGFNLLDASFGRFWNWEQSQLWSLVLSTCALIRNGQIARLRSWWINPLGSTVPGALATVPILIVALGSALALVMILNGPASSGEQGG